MPRTFFPFCLLVALGGCMTPAADPQAPQVRHVRLIETARLAPLEVTPVAVTEDSRCPIGVQCIQAGTVRVRARIADSAGARDMILSLNVPIEIGDRRLSLARVCPYPVHGSPIRPNSYLFSLKLAAAGAPLGPELPACPPR